MTDSSRTPELKSVAGGSVTAAHVRAKPLPRRLSLAAAPSRPCPRPDDQRGTLTESASYTSSCRRGEFTGDTRRGAVGGRRWGAARFRDARVQSA